MRSLIRRAIAIAAEFLKVGVAVCVQKAVEGTMSTFVNGVANSFLRFVLRNAYTVWDMVQSIFNPNHVRHNYYFKDETRQQAA